MKAKGSKSLTVVDIVALLPRPDAEALEHVGHKDADELVPDEVVSDAEMSCVVGYKRQKVEEKSKRKRRYRVTDVRKRDRVNCFRTIPKEE